jgi:DNA-binding response OmpR family regulator
MNSPASGGFDSQRIVVADEDLAVATFVVETLREDGHAVFHGLDGLSAVQLVDALDECHLLLSDMRGVDGIAALDLLAELRRRRPAFPIVYIANVGRSTPELEAQLPAGVPILREPFTADELRALTRALLRAGGPLQ